MFYFASLVVSLHIGIRHFLFVVIVVSYFVIPVGCIVRSDASLVDSVVECLVYYDCSDLVLACALLMCCVSAFAFRHPWSCIMDGCDALACISVAHTLGCLAALGAPLSSVE